MHVLSRAPRREFAPAAVTDGINIDTVFQPFELLQKLVRTPVSAGRDWTNDRSQLGRWQGSLERIVRVGIELVLEIFFGFLVDCHVKQGGVGLNGSYRRASASSSLTIVSSQRTSTWVFLEILFLKVFGGKVNVPRIIGLGLSLEKIRKRFIAIGTNYGRKIGASISKENRAGVTAGRTNRCGIEGRECIITLLVLNNRVVFFLFWIQSIVNVFDFVFLDSFGQGRYVGFRLGIGIFGIFHQEPRLLLRVCFVVIIEVTVTDILRIAFGAINIVRGSVATHLAVGVLSCKNTEIEERTNALALRIGRFELFCARFHFSRSFALAFLWD